MNLSPEEDKNRVLALLRLNLEAMPDDPDEVAALVPSLDEQAHLLTPMVDTRKCTPAELRAYVALLGPIVLRSGAVESAADGRKKRRLRVV